MKGATPISRAFATAVVVALMSAFVVVIPSSAQPAPVSFKSPVTYSPGSNCPGNTSSYSVSALAVASADMNGDGRMDLVVANRSRNNSLNSCIGILLGTGGGMFAPAKLFTTNGRCVPSDPAQAPFFANLNVPMTISTADLNGDGRSDVVTGGSGRNCVGVFLNATTKGAAAVKFTAGSPRLFGSCDNYSEPGWISTANMDRDKDIDITVVAGNEDFKQAKASVMVNKGNATFNPSICKAPYAGTKTGVGLTKVGYPQNVLNADLNGDGLNDIATLTYNGGVAKPVTVLLNQAAAPGSFVGAQTFGWTGAAASDFDDGAGLSSGDVNNDGRQDLIVGSMGNNNVVVLLNRTASASSKAVFVQGATIDMGSAETVDVADMNGDGNADIVTSAPEVLLGRGDGTFAPAQSFSIGNSGYATVAKLTGGLPSIVAIDFDTSQLHVLVNTTPVPPKPPKRKQTAQIKCGPPAKIKPRGFTLLLCPTYTNIGQPVSVNIAGQLRGDVVAFRKITRPNGNVFIQTFGYPLNIRVAYKAPGTSTYHPYVRIVRYQT